MKLLGLFIGAALAQDAMDVSDQSNGTDLYEQERGKHKKHHGKGQDSNHHHHNNGAVHHGNNNGHGHGNGHNHHGHDHHGHDHHGHDHGYNNHGHGHDHHGQYNNHDHHGHGHYDGHNHHGHGQYDGHNHGNYQHGHHTHHVHNHHVHHNHQPDNQNDNHVIPCIVPAYGLKCWTCNGGSNEECARNGYSRTCLPNETSCMIEMRKRDGKITSVSMGCKAPDACLEQMAYNFEQKHGDGGQCHPEPARRGPSTCRQCCQNGDHCFGDGDGYHFDGVLHATDHDWGMNLMKTCDGHDHVDHHFGGGDDHGHGH